MTAPKWYDPKITLGNILTVVAMIAALVGGYINLKSEVQGASASSQQAITAITQVRAQVDDFEPRMAVVERNQVTGREAREEFQAETKQELREQRAILTAILQSVARLEAKGP